MPPHSYMHDEPTPRKLPERTGRHFCVICRGEIPADEYFRNDHVCDGCAQKEKEKDEREPRSGDP